ncbi:MAG: ABC transporter ATP-binding protein [Leptospiraceae bacterium]|nr:ABC transporter ATP-binding protein [Leptospiraceae bacterium]MCK6382198.1 ABC transporter ATP-binding protein [Leptospiraceae bacterium]NUM42665.1 ABC transporter ATP-binding protein [Leptospiraceae bacterium]
MALVEIKNLNKSYFKSEKGVPILTNLDFTVLANEIVSVEGSSGVGKSTLLNILGAMDNFESGKVVVCGESLSDMKEREKERFRREKISFIFQHHLLLPDFTALENVMMPLLISGVKKNKARSQSLEILERVGLISRTENYPSEISGGESARVGVARALVAKKQLILADEPTGNLDRENSRNLMGLVLGLQKEFQFSMILVTHDMELASLAFKRNRIVSGKLQPI